MGTQPQTVEASAAVLHPSPTESLGVPHNVVSALSIDSFRHQLETFPRFQTAILLLLFLQWNRVYLGHHEKVTLTYLLYLLTYLLTYKSERKS